ncbi:MAG: beta-ketoacyl synthase N-terminal-like domain-containing protein [bacterium]
MKAWITAGAYITSQAFGRWSDAVQPVLDNTSPKVPKAKEIFDTPMGRYGRFDLYTRMGCAAVALCLHDAGLDVHNEIKRNIGIVTSSHFGCMQRDLEFYDSSIEEGGQLASPNLFSYTLPGIMHGECAVHFKLQGPTLALGDRPYTKDDCGGMSLEALKCAMRFLMSDNCNAMIAGWVDSPSETIEQDYETALRGALMVLIEKEHRSPMGDVEALSLEFGDGELRDGSGEMVDSILELFRISDDERRG